MTEVLEAEVLGEIMEEWGAEVGRRLHRRRKLLNLSLEQVAARAGVSRQTVHRAELDGRTVRDGTRQQIAAALLVEVAEMWEPLSRTQLHRRAAKVA